VVFGRQGSGEVLLTYDILWDSVFGDDVFFCFCQSITNSRDLDREQNDIM